MNDYQTALWNKHYPYAMVISGRNSVHLLEFITSAQLAEIKRTRKYVYNGHVVAIVQPESHCVQSAWPLAMIDAGKKTTPVLVYQDTSLTVDTCIVNGKWETLLMGQTYVHADLFSASLFHWSMVQSTVRPTITKERLYDFAVALHEALGMAADAMAECLDEVAAIKERNAVLLRTQTAPIKVGMQLMMSNTFQAGLNALDPEAPCFVRSAAIREVLQRGLFSIIDQHLADDATYVDIDDYIEDGMYPQQEKVAYPRKK